METSELQRRIAALPKERVNIRNNVEVTIFQLGYHYRGNSGSKLPEAGTGAVETPNVGALAQHVGKFQADSEMDIGANGE